MKKEISFSQEELLALYSLIKMYVENQFMMQGYHGEDQHEDESYKPISERDLKTILQKIKPLMEKEAFSKAKDIFIESKYGDWNRVPEESIIRKINKIMNNRKVACIEYYSPDAGVSKRNVDIYARNARYIVGFCRLRKNIRKFRISRIVSIKVLEEIFETPEDFDKKKFL